MTKATSIIKKFRKYYSMYSEYMTLKKKIAGTSPNIYLFGTPNHSNMGDQAQTYCIINWMNKNYPEHTVHTFYLKNSTNRILQYLRKNINKEDKIFCHSGYHLTNLYDEQRIYSQLVRMFPDFPIVIFPQTINYTLPEAARETAALFNNHKNLTILCRDEVSFKTAQTLFNKCHLLLYPDVVTSLIGTKQFNHERNGILFCIRNDKEAFYNPEQISGLRKRIEQFDTVSMTDTTISLPASEIMNNREKILNGIFEDYSKYKLIITDRYHGTIFSLIAGTPVIVLSSSDHKLSSGVKWFPPEFSDYVRYATSLDEAFQFAELALNKELNHRLPAYFLENYWNVLKQRINHPNSH
jgi:exopolysaccharide biosynthesis predicted pyruvyltransferase EpsI